MNWAALLSSVPIGRVADRLSRFLIADLLLISICGLSQDLLAGTFQDLTLADIQAAELSGAYIDASYGGQNPLPAGAIVLYQTNEGRFGKMQVVRYGYNLTIDWVTFNPNGSVFSEGRDLAVFGTEGCDLDVGRVILDKTSDFLWDQVDTLERGLEPLSGALFAVYRILPERWAPTGDLNTGRSHHTATRLLNGAVLVVGGLRGTVALSPVEIYDPLSGNWALTSPLTTPRWGHTATLLTDGRVLVVGGRQGDFYLGRTQIYDPDSSRWSDTGELHVARTEHVAALLPDGRVLVAGGRSSSGDLTSVEFYDPVAGSWSVGPDLGEARSEAAVTLRKDGDVLVIGGGPSNAESYDTGSLRWSRGGDLVGLFPGKLTANLMDDGEVFLFGPESPLLYASGTWVATARNLSFTPRTQTTTLLPNGSVLLVGDTDSSELFDPRTSTWSLISGNEFPRGNHTATLLKDGRVLVVGGERDGQSLASSEVIDVLQIFYPHLVLGGGFEVALFVTNQSEVEWSGQARLNGGDWPREWQWSLNGEDRSGQSFFDLRIPPLATQKVILTSRDGPYTGSLEIRGSTSTSSLATSFFYNYVVSGQLLDSTAVAPAVRARKLSFPVEKTRWINTGIALRRSTPRSTDNRFDFSLYDEEGRFLQETTRTLDGAVFVDEIFPISSEEFIGSVSVETLGSLYLTVLRQEIVPGGSGLSFQLTSVPAREQGKVHAMPNGGTPWEATADMSSDRSLHTMTSLEDGRVLVAGGQSEVTFLRDAELYEPKTATWAGAGTMQAVRAGHTATRLLDGRVLVVGGVGWPDTVEIYDPSRNLWSETDSLTHGRFRHTATLLRDGRVLVAGGGHARAEIYDPERGEWSLTGSLSQERESHAATLTRLGLVVAVGGTPVAGASEPLKSVETYRPDTGDWTSGLHPDLNIARFGHTATLLTDGSLLVAGGLPRDSAATTAEILPAFESPPGWKATGRLRSERINHRAALLPDGRVLLVGGLDAPEAEVLDLVRRRWRSTDRIDSPRSHLGLTVMENGQVLIAGGGDSFGSFATSEVADFSQIVYPQFALGGGFEVVLLMTNADEDAWAGRVVLDGGSWPSSRPWRLDGTDSTGTSGFELELKPRETRKLVFSSSEGPFSGWLEIRGSQFMGNLATAFFYTYKIDGVLQDSTGVQSPPPLRALCFPIERSGTANTGVAVRGARMPVPFYLYDADGNLLQETSVALDGARFVNEIFVGLPDEFVGSVIIDRAFSDRYYLTVLRQEVLPGPELRFQLTSIPATIRH